MRRQGTTTLSRPFVKRRCVDRTQKCESLREVATQKTIAAPHVRKKQKEAVVVVAVAAAAVAVGATAAAAREIMQNRRNKRRISLDDRTVHKTSIVTICFTTSKLIYVFLCKSECPTTRLMYITCHNPGVCGDRVIVSFT